MKKLIIALAIVCMFAAQAAFATIVSTNLVPYATSGGLSTNFGRPLLIGTAYIANPPNFLISDGGTVNTNSLFVYVQYGLSTNSTTMATVATYTKATTNATEGVVNPANITLSIYAQTMVVTTNAVDVGTKAVFIQ